MAGPAHGILGNASSPLEPPKREETFDQDREDLRRIAQFAKSPEFAKLKGLLEAKISYWQQYVPGASGVMGGDVVDITQLGNEERGWRWLAANSVIGELRGIIAAYEQAQELAADETAK